MPDNVNYKKLFNETKQKLEEAELVIASLRQVNTEQAKALADLKRVYTDKTQFVNSITDVFTRAIKNELRG